MRFETVSGSADEAITEAVLVTPVEPVAGDVLEVDFDEEFAVESGEVTGVVEPGFVVLRRLEDC